MSQNEKKFILNVADAAFWGCSVMLICFLVKLTYDSWDAPMELKLSFFKLPLYLTIGIPMAISYGVLFLLGEKEKKNVEGIAGEDK